MFEMAAPHSRLLVADEVWIATALLHREHPDAEDFSVAEIVARAQRENATEEGVLRPGVRVHATQHCVANKPPNPGRYCMLLETVRGRRRLYRRGDSCDPARRSSKQVPREEDLPVAYRELLDWYRREYAAGETEDTKADPILSLRGLGKEMWVAESADDYVKRLREGWE